MSEANIRASLASVQKSMEFEGFTIDEALREKGRRILEGKATGNELVGEYLRSVKRHQDERAL